MTTQSFKSTITKTGNRTFIKLPFNPNEAWGAKERHHVRGTINGHMIRGSLSNHGESYFIPLGDAWRRDNELDVGADVEVVLFPEGPQTANMATDINRALASEAEAKAFFEALPTFYRNNYIRWIESAKRPETRAARISEMVGLLKEGKKQK